MKDIGGRIATDAKEVTKSNVEAARAAKNQLVNIASKAQDAFKEVWGKAIKEKLNPEQEKLVDELKGIFTKMGNGKFLAGEEALKVIAAVLAGGSTEGIPSFKAYNKQLERLHTTPGLASIKLSVKIAGKAK